jgi:hypothetical protein
MRGSILGWPTYCNKKQSKLEKKMSLLEPYSEWVYPVHPDKETKW